VASEVLHLALTVREEFRLRVFENRVLSGAKLEGVTGDSRELRDG
jgi:hypothetical protein